MCVCIWLENVGNSILCRWENLLDSERGEYLLMLSSILSLLYRVLASRIADEMRILGWLYHVCMCVLTEYVRKRRWNDDQEGTYRLETLPKAYTSGIYTHATQKTICSTRRTLCWPSRHCHSTKENKMLTTMMTDESGDSSGGGYTSVGSSEEKWRIEKYQHIYTHIYFYSY